MDSVRSVRNLKDLIKNLLKPSETIISSETSKLTAPGENYGSIMLRILVKVKDNETGTVRTLDTVGKTMPDSERVQEVFDTQVTFRNEYQYYATVIPTLDKFLKSKGFEKGADFAATFHGGRLNFTNSERVDEDAIILLENLKPAGYVTGKKTEGLDVEATKVVLDSLAKFHASGLALRVLAPDTFERNLEPYFYCITLVSDISELVFRNLVHTLESTGFSKKDIDTVAKVYQSDHQKKNISDKWGTIIHYDSWTNNLLLKYNGSKPVHCVLVDFQVFDYGTPLNDVMFFLFSSLHQDSFEQNLDILLEYYYEKFVDYLNRLGIDTKTFTKASFDEEVVSAVKNYEYYHAMWMLLPIMHEEFKSIDDLESDFMNSLLNYSAEHVHKIKSITRLCLERNWL